MKPETVKLAQDLFVAVFASAEGLGNATEEQRRELFTQGANICLDAAVAFEAAAAAYEKDPVQ